jgi:hypothetical protein
VDFWEWTGFALAVLVLGSGLLWLRAENKQNADSIAKAANARGWRYERRWQEGPSALERSAFAIGLRTGVLTDSEHIITGTHRGHEFEAYEQINRYRTSGEGATSQDRHYLYAALALSPHRGTVVVAERAPAGALSAALNALGKRPLTPRSACRRTTNSSRARC